MAIDSVILVSPQEYSPASFSSVKLNKYEDRQHGRIKSGGSDIWPTASSSRLPRHNPDEQPADAGDKALLHQPLPCCGCGAEPVVLQHSRLEPVECHVRPSAEEGSKPGLDTSRATEEEFFGGAADAHVLEHPIRLEPESAGAC